MKIPFRRYLSVLQSRRTRPVAGRQSGWTAPRRTLVSVSRGAHCGSCPRRSRSAPAAWVVAVALPGLPDFFWYLLSTLWSPSPGEPGSRCTAARPVSPRANDRIPPTFFYRYAFCGASSCQSAVRGRCFRRILLSWRTCVEPVCCERECVVEFFYRR